MSEDPATSGGRSARSTREVYRGAALAVALTWSLRAIGLLSVFIMARLLTPSDFGVVGLAMTAVAMVEMFSYLGLWQALVRLPDPDRSHLDTAWTIQLGMFASLALVLFAIAGPVADFYREPRVEAVIYALSLRFLMLGLSNIGTVAWERDLDFGRDLKMRAGARLLSFGVTIVLALWLQSYWALVAGMIAQSMFQTIASYVMHPFRPRFSIERRRELLGVSLWIFAGIMAQIVQSQIERIVVGRTATTASVGAFAVSKDLSSILTQEIATALNRVTFVQTSRGGAFNEQGSRLATMLGGYAMMAAPMGLGLAAVSQSFIAVFLGSQWDAAASLVVPIAAASAVMAVYKLVASSLSAGGHERISAMLSIGGAALMGVIVMAVADRGPSPLAIAFAGLVASLALLAVGLATLATLSRHSTLRFVTAVVRPFIAAAIMFYALTHFPLVPGPALADLVVRGAVGAAIYFTALGLLWLASGRPTSAEGELLRVVRRVVRR